MSEYNISIIVPVFNEEGNIRQLHKKIAGVMKRIRKPFQLLFVDDGSTDNTPNIIESLNEQHYNVHLIQFRRNFGKSAAYSAGFQNVLGDIIVTMDGDLQDDPEDIPKLLQKMHEGYDFVAGRKKNKYRFYQLKSIGSFIFNRLTSLMTGIRLHDIDCPFKAFKKEVLNELKIYGELHRYIPVLVHNAGFSITEVFVKNHPRKHGVSKFGGGKLVRGFLDLITVFFLTRYSKRPLHFFGYAGLSLLIMGILLSIYTLFQRFILGFIIKDWFIILSALLMIIGIQFISVGLIGEMITYIHSEKYKGFSIKKIIKRK